jgi:hypothetical protein
MPRPVTPPVELEHFDPAVPPDSEGGELAAPSEAQMAALSDDVTVEEVEHDGFGRRAATLPQPDRARSSPDLPRVKSSVFPRLLK